MSTLSEQIDAIHFSEEAVDLFLTLVSPEAFSDPETTAVILVAASKHLIRLQPTIVLGGSDSILAEFSDLVRHLGKWIRTDQVHRGKPKLRIVGGTDA